MPSNQSSFNDFESITTNIKQYLFFFSGESRFFVRLLVNDLKAAQESIKGHVIHVFSYLKVPSFSLCSSKFIADDPENRLKNSVNVD